MGNCLKTQLKSEVQNDNLPIFNNFVITASHSDESLVGDRKPRLAFNTVEAFDVETDGNYLSLNSDLSNPTKKITIEAGSSNTTIYCVNPAAGSSYKINVKGRYNEGNNVNIQGPIFSLELGDIVYRNETSLVVQYCNLTGDIKELSKLSRIDEIKLFNTRQITGDISTVINSQNKSTIRSLNFGYDSLVGGSLSDIVELTALLIIALNNTQVEGDANIFADSSKFTALTSLDLRNTPNITNKTEEVKALVEAAHPGITVTW